MTFEIRDKAISRLKHKTRFSRSTFPAENNKRDFSKTHFQAKTANGILPKHDSEQK